MSPARRRRRARAGEFGLPVCPGLEENASRGGFWLSPRKCRAAVRRHPAIPPQNLGGQPQLRSGQAEAGFVLPPLPVAIGIAHHNKGDRSTEPDPWYIHELGFGAKRRHRHTEGGPGMLARNVRSLRQDHWMQEGFARRRQSYVAKRPGRRRQRGVLCPEIVRNRGRASPSRPYSRQPHAPRRRPAKRPFAGSRVAPRRPGVRVPDSKAAD